ncbi:MAG: site-specific DNA-methyltransferase [Anaerolineae bacterium]|nr:site-specific DNA-methyltransferase [Anaerolineae bacterium]
MPIEKLTPTQPAAERQAALRDAVLAALRTHAPEALADDNINWEVLQESLNPPRGDADDEAAPPDAAERFGLFWHGKRAARKLAASPSRLALHPASGEGVNEASTRNLYLEGDNLEVLKLLQKAYAGQVKMIYIDPPYNTGNDFVYKDDYRDSADDYLRKTGQMGEGGELLSSNPKASGRFHSNWLNMIYPRLMLARQLLRDDGVIFVSIDDNEVHNLRQVMDEVFGAENLLSTFIWHRRQMADSRNKDKVSVDHEYVLAYKKLETALKGKEIDLSKYSNPDNDPRGPWFSADLTGLANASQRPNLHYSVTNPLTKLTYPPSPTRGWSVGKEKFNELIDENKILWPSKPDGRPRLKKFLSEVINFQTGFSTILDTVYTTEGTRLIQEIFEEKIFSFPKPVDLIQQICGQIEGSENIILDFFSGSATTAHAVLAQNLADGGNRRFIMVQLPEATGRTDYPTIAEIGKERIRRVIAKLQSERDAAKPSKSPALQGSLALADADNEAESAPAAHGHLDLGFKVFKLGPSNVQAWQPFVPQHNGGMQDLFAMQAQLAQAQSPLVAGWQAADVLTEVMLIEGFALDADVRQQPIFAHNTVWLVQSEACAHRLFVCLDPSLHSHSIDEAAHSLRSADVWICLDSALSDQAKLRLSDVCKVRVI